MLTYYDPKFLEVLKANLSISDDTLHKIMNPYCGQCLLERGEKVLNDLPGVKSNPR